MALQFENTKQTIQLAKQDRIIEEHRLSKRKRVTIDANDMFASITSVIEAQEAQKEQKARWERLDRLKEARESSNLLVQQGMNAFVREWHASDVVVVQEDE